MAKREQKRPQRRLWPLLVGSVFFGVVAALLAIAYLQSVERALIARLQPEEEREIAVAVASRDLQRGTVISLENFQKREIPVRYVHSDAITPQNFGQFEGRSITVPLEAGKPLLRSHLDDDFPIDFSDIVEKGRRAITVTVDEVNSIAGFIRPGNHVDLLVNIPFSESGLSSQGIQAGLQKVSLNSFGNVDELEKALANLPEALSADDATAMFLPGEVIIPVVQDIRVLATGRDPYLETLDQLRQPQPRRERNFSSITLDVSVHQAAMISAAQDKGDLLALLRNRNDRTNADFASVSARDLFGNAEAMAREQAQAQLKVKAPAGVNNRGELVDSDGKVIASAESLAAAGFSVDKDGNIVDKDGNIVDSKDLIVTADGRVMSRKQLEDSGLRVDAQGRIVDKDGNVVNPDDVAVTADGKVLRRDQLAAAGLSVNEKGEIVDSTGRVVDPKNLVVTADGKILTREQLEKAGFTVNENGEVVDKDGNVVDPTSLTVTADGRVLTQEEARKELAGTRSGAGTNSEGALVDANGQVVASAEQLAAAGLRVNEQGQIVDKNGNIVDPKDLVVTADGQVMSRQALAEAGLTVNEDGIIVDENGYAIDANKLVVRADGSIVTREQFEAEGDPTAIPASIQLIVGGASKDGIAKATQLQSAQTSSGQGDSEAGAQ